MTDPIRIFLCDDHALFRQGVRKLLELEPDINVVGEASNGKEMLENAKKADPDVILIDIAMPQMDGVAAALKIKKILPQIHIIILTVCEDKPYVFNAIKA